MKITVIGAGSWGTALAIHYSLHGHPVSIWARNREQMAAMQNERENQRYLPGFPLPDNLTAHTELTEALEGSELVLMVTSVAGLRDSVELIKQAGYGHLPILTACKGFELDTSLLTFQVVREILPDNDKIGVLSGPSFAQELAKQLPCAVVLASENEKWINGLVQELNTPVMRLYANTDIIGAAVGGAVKNVMAIATGLSDGLEYGMNARAALVTRGLAEMTHDGTGRYGRPHPHLHRRTVAQPKSRPGSGFRQATAPSPDRNRPCRRRRTHHRRSIQHRLPAPNRHADYPNPVRTRTQRTERKRCRRTPDDARSQIGITPQAV